MKNFKLLIGCLTVMLLSLVITGCEDEMMAEVKVGSISAEAVFQGSPVSLTGEGFDQVQFVFVGNIQTSFTLDGNTITFTVPDEAPVGETTITLAMPRNVRATYVFEVVLKPSPVITSFDAYVPVGGDLVIKGSSLNNNTSVTVDGISATVVSAGDSELVVTVPSGVDETSAIEFEITTTYGVAKPTTAFYARESVIPNSDLEAEGDGVPFAGWELLNAGDGAITAITSGYGGSRSMRVVPAAGNPWDRQVASTAVPLNFGDVYTVVLWAKGETAGAQMRVSVSQYDGNGADYFYGETVEMSTNWEQYTWTFTVTNDLPTHRVVLDMGMGAVPFAIDQIGLVPGSIGASGPVELLANSSFETDLTGWTALNGAAEVTSAEAYCGSQSMTATGAGGNPWDVQIASDAMELEVGTDYEIGFWAKAAGPDGVFRLSMSQFASGQSDDFFYSPDLTIPEEWTYFSFVTTAQATSTGNHRLLFDMGASTQTFFVDGVSVKEYEVSSSSEYSNGGFEDGLTGWTALNGAAEASTDAHSGSGSMTATGAGGNPWDTQIASDAVALTVGNQYKISFWAKAAGPDGVFRISMSQYDGNGADFFYSRDLEIPEDWSYFAFVTTVQATASGDHRLLFDMGATTQTFFIDDVSVVEHDACE